MVRTQHFHCSCLGLIPGWETKIPQAMQSKKKRLTKIRNGKESPLGRRNMLDRNLDLQKETEYEKC